MLIFSEDLVAPSIFYCSVEFLQDPKCVLRATFRTVLAVHNSLQDVFFSKKDRILHKTFESIFNDPLKCLKLCVCQDFRTFVVFFLARITIT